MAVYIAAAGMTIELGDRVLETTQTTGTGTYSLDGVSADGRQSFLNAIGNGNRTLYVVEMGTSWEIAIGTVTTGAPVTLSRDFIWKSSNSNNAVNWQAGVKSIFCDAASVLLEEAAYQGQANVFTDIQTISTGNDDESPFLIENANGDPVVLGRVGTTGAGRLTLRTSAGVETASLSATNNSRGSLLLNSFEVYPLGEGAATAQGVGSPSTAIDFSINRLDARRITVMCNGLSFSGTESLLIQLGTAGGIVATGYTSNSNYIDESASTVAGAISTGGFIVSTASSATTNLTGHMVLTHLGNDIWIESHTFAARGVGTDTAVGGGSIDLSAVATQLRVTSTGTPNNIDAGSVSILVE